MMKIRLTILCLTLVGPLYGQFEVFPIYRLVDIDSIESKDNQHIKTIKVKNDAIDVNIDSKTYSFISSGVDGNSKYSYPTFTADYDDKYHLEIWSWEIIEIGAKYVTFKLTYTRRNKSNGSQKGKYYVLDNYKIDKDKIVGFYAGQVDKEDLKKVNLINVGLAGIVIVAFIIGTQ